MTNRKLNWLRAVSLIASDMIGISVAFLFAALIALSYSPYLGGLGFRDLFTITFAEIRPSQIIALGGVLILWFSHQGHYSHRFPFWIEARMVVTGCLFALLFDGFLQYSLKHEFSRLWLFNTWLCAVPCILIGRSLVRSVLKTAGLWMLPTLVVGAPDRVSEITLLLDSQPGLGLKVVGGRSLKELSKDGPPNWHHVCQSLEACQVVIGEETADLLRHRDAIQALTLAQIPFLCLQSMAGLPVESLLSFPLIGHDVLMLVDQRRPDFSTKLIKSAFDKILALILLILLSPLMIVIALLIRRDGGPALFAQARVGQNGKSFQCLKFRTMVENAPDKLDDYFRINPEAQQEWTQTQKLKNDPRITQHGLFIRAWSLDELPQLFNVLKGEMSLVGPRPMEFGQIPLSGDDLQFYLMAKPGITGLWQVSGRSHLTFEERVHLGTWYVKNWSLWLDIVILSRTIPTVLTKRGAY